MGGQSTESQYPSFSSIRPSPHEYPSARMTYESPHQMPQHYAQAYQYPQPQGQTSHSHASSNPTNYTLPPGHSGQQYRSSYGQHSMQGQNLQYQYQSPQYQFQPQRYERPRFRYPPPQLPPHLPTGSVAPFGGHPPQGSYQHYQGSNLDTGQSLLQSATSRGSHETDAHSPEQSLRNVDDSGLTIEPLPYSPRSRPRKESGSPLHKKRKPDPPR